MKKLIWFFGPSCAGKASTINNILADNQSIYMEILDLNSATKIIKCEESLDKSRPRDELTSVILNKCYSSNADILLIKGQTADLDRETPENVRSQLPKTEHIIVFLWATPEELNCRRLKARSEDPWDNWSINTHIDELKVQIEEAAKLKGENFPVIWIDNTGSQPRSITYDEVLSKTQQLEKYS